MDPPTGPAGRLPALGALLTEIHLWLREELARLRADLDPWPDGRGRRPRELRMHCVGFCSALRRHHAAEDGGAFPLLAEGFPELRPVLEELKRDHRLVAEALGRLEELLDGPEARGPEPAAVGWARAELDGLAALLESHFVYEERRVAAALDSLSALSRDNSPTGSPPPIPHPRSLLGFQADDLPDP